VEHSAALMAKALAGRIGRLSSNIRTFRPCSDEPGMPWIAGYIPKRNDQNAILGAIDRYLSRSPELLTFVPAAREKEAPLASTGNAFRYCRRGRTTLRRGLGSVWSGSLTRCSGTFGTLGFWARPARSWWLVLSAPGWRSRGEAIWPVR
jgi:hypothetical protein